MNKKLKPAMLALAGLTLAAGSALANPIAPADVSYEDGAVSVSLTGTVGNAAEGQKVMTSRGLGNCIACHEVTALKDHPFHGEVGPSLDGAGDRWTEAEMRGIVANSKMMFEGSIMPSFYKQSGYIRPGNAYTGKAAAPEDLAPLLTAQQIEDVVAYLMTLKDG